MFVGKSFSFSFVCISSKVDLDGGQYSPLIPSIKVLNVLKDQYIEHWFYVPTRQRTAKDDHLT